MAIATILPFTRSISNKYSQKFMWDLLEIGIKKLELEKIESFLCRISTRLNHKRKMGKKINIHLWGCLAYFFLKQANWGWRIHKFCTFLKKYMIQIGRKIIKIKNKGEISLHQGAAKLKGRKIPGISWKFPIILFYFLFY